MLYEMFGFSAIKRFLDNASHRLRGDMAVTVNGKGFWITDIYSEDGMFKADVANGPTLELKPWDDILVTGY